MSPFLFTLVYFYTKDISNYVLRHKNVSHRKATAYISEQISRVNSDHKTPFVNG